MVKFVLQLSTKFLLVVLGFLGVDNTVYNF